MTNRDTAESVAGLTDVINSMRIETSVTEGPPSDGDLKVAISNMIAACTFGVVDVNNELEVHTT